MRIFQNKKVVHLFTHNSANFLYQTNQWTRYCKLKEIWYNKISSNFAELFVIGKYVKIRFKKGGQHAIFSDLGVKIAKTLQKLNKRDCFSLPS